MISLIFIPFLVCLLLVFVHVYFGAFVLKRGILFIDLALAQWAALGYVVGQWLHLESPLHLFLIAFSFTLIAGFILTMLKPIYDKVHLQEAVIGVMYIGATAIATGLISSTGMESHHLQEMLSGKLLFVSAKELGFATMLYTGIALLVYKFHNHFLTQRSRLWDFVFYLLFGLVVTSSVKMVGVLLVFSYLVIPILSIILFTKTFKHQLFLGWIVGALASFLGLGFSLYSDIPPSYSVILVLCFIWGLTTLVKYKKA